MIKYIANQMVINLFGIFRYLHKIIHFYGFMYFSNYIEIVNSI